MRGACSVFVLAALAACQSGASRGTPCLRSADCGAGLQCALGACRAACRESRDCGADQRCLIEPSTGISVCSVEMVDDCTAHGCPDGLVCASGACVNACGTVVTCPDGVCVGDVCRRVVGDAGVLPDAAPDVDAGSNCHGPGCDPVVALAMGAQRALAVTASGALWGWGNSASAALGDGVSSHAGCANCSALPVRALAAAGSPLAGVVAASVGFDFGCALIRDQTVQCWGRNYAGQRGDGHADDGILVPRQVVRDDGTGGTVILDHVTQIRSGDEFTCAVRDAAAGGVDAGVSASTEVWCWGAGAEGQLGTGAAVPYSNIALHATELGTHTISLAIAGTHVLALSSDGTILGIGDDSCGVVGSTTTSASRLTAGLGQVTGASEIATTLYHTCAITSPSTAPGLSCWGMASEALGSGSVPTMACPSCGRNCATMPFSLAQPSEPIEHLFGPSGGTFFGTTASGALYVWGGAFNEPFDSITVPTLVRVPPAIEAHVGGTAACALTRDGDVLCWGSNDQGQLGRGTITGVGMIDHTPNTVMW